MKYSKPFRVLDLARFLKTDSATYILQEIFHAYRSKKSFYEKLYLIFRISSPRLYQSFNFIISFYKKKGNFKNT